MRLSTLPIVACTLLACAGCTSRDQQAHDLGAPSVQPAERRLAADLRLTESKLRGLQTENGLLRQEIEDLRQHLAERPATSGADQRIELPTLREAEAAAYQLGADLAFGRGSATLSAEGRQRIAELARTLQSGANAGRPIRIAGHSDSTPVTRPSSIQQFGDNWGLSARRAASVVSALIEQGIAAERLTGLFYGPSRPIGPDKSANRRVEIFID